MVQDQLNSTRQFFQHLKNREQEIEEDEFICPKSLEPTSCDSCESFCSGFNGNGCKLKNECETYKDAKAKI